MGLSGTPWSESEILERALESAVKHDYAIEPFAEYRVVHVSGDLFSVTLPLLKGGNIYMRVRMSVTVKKEEFDSIW